ncbi:Protocadherin gamma-A8 [Bagarius yarrelli]|uniref:Protocadherin gamma-A8 n=1 Tax=Bagarius yarrelli TaxID=175774 RepID=A0A556V5G0_BAGYA|nr:Protocadherin gamma-A8 [Bagarius yarrelli]
MDFASGQARYSIPEETPEGSFVGNIAQDLGIEISRLVSGKARVVTKGGRQYVELSRDKGSLVVKERIDREELCKQTTPCSFSFDLIMENPIELHRVTVEVQDINDNAPTFPKGTVNLQISENTETGARFPLDRAVDLDVGVNDIKTYSLSPSDHFKLEIISDANGNKHIEMVLQRELDREERDELKLVLTAYDGGSPKKSGTMQIHISVLDVNDNKPVCKESVYKAELKENSPSGTVVTALSATDADEGINGIILYSIAQASKEARNIFNINSETGIIKTLNTVDYENEKNYELNINAMDKGGLADTCKVIIEIIDENDNSPSIQLMSFSNIIPENSPVGTTVAVINVEDADSGPNGLVHCKITENMPFKIESTLSDYYALITDETLDRENIAEYNITILVSDQGSPARHSNKTLNVKISDVNDNPPVFSSEEYKTHVNENNSPGEAVLTVKASDADWGPNARLSYFVEDNNIQGNPVSSLVSVDSESGLIRAIKTYDYEQMKSFSFNVTARDGGSPPLNSEVTVTIIVQDQNDNAPQVLYPVQTGGSVVAEIVPRSADVGYLVTKVVAVDVDSGQNAWLSYRLQKVTDRALFEVGAQNGEIRTVRQVTDKDAVKQKLTVVVEDNGQPSRSAVVNINVAVADTFPEVLSEFTDFTHSKQYNDDLTFYLVLALAAVSFLFITTVVVIISVKIYRWRQSRLFYQSNLPVIPYYPPGYTDTGVTATLPHMYHYDACMTTDSRKSDCKYSTLGARYSIPEETPEGSFVGNIAQDLGIEISRLVSGKARVVTKGGRQYVELSRDKGSLVVKERIDREELCKQTTPCSFSFDLIMENPIELHRVTVEVQDINDNAPKFPKGTVNLQISENTASGTRFPLDSAVDLDVGVNGIERYSLSQNDHFRLIRDQSVDKKIVGMLLHRELDREDRNNLELILTAYDGGSPKKSGSMRIDITILDVNDNAPLMSFSNIIAENSPVGTTVAVINVEDADSGPNGLVHCKITENMPFKIESTLSDYYALITDETLGRENIAEYNITILVSDQGSPARHSNKTLNVKISDVNDNPPVFSSEEYKTHVNENNSPGEAVLTVKASDADWGPNARLSYYVEDNNIQGNANAWLSYRLQKVTDRALFEVGAQNGEIRTVRQVTDKDAVKQKLTVVVEDNGQPSRSAVVNINVAVADTFPEVLSEFTDFTHSKQYNDDLTFYLVLALAAVSFLFITTVVVIISVKIYRWRQSRLFYQSNLPVIPYYPPGYTDTGVTATLPHMYHYDACMTTDSRKSDCKYSTLGARYSIPEETPEGSFVGNIAQDLGIEISRLVSGKARVVTKGGRQYVELSRDKGSLVVKERIDREELCKQTTPCSFSFDLIMENPIELHRVTVEVQDINDNAPTFPKGTVNLQISEHTTSGKRFQLDSAVDLDVGVNGIERYSLSQNDHFKVETHNQADGQKSVEMILNRELDREERHELKLVLTAYDGGSPKKSGTMQIHISVLDANDNAPVCKQSIYKAEVKENSPSGTVVTAVSATDADEGINGLITYSLGRAGEEARMVFDINTETGAITTLKGLDYESKTTYQININAMDKLGLTDTCKVIIEIIDENDNSPSIQLMSFSNIIPENSPVGTTVAVINVEDADSGPNGLVHCKITENMPFKIESTLSDYYALITDETLDRENIAEYNITILVSDQGSPARHSNKTLNVKISDVNDNPPVFSSEEYKTHVNENNSPGEAVLTVKASDADWGPNARLSYFVEDNNIQGNPVSSLVSVDSESGVIRAIKTYDYEQMKSFSFNVTARDGGSPPLSSEVTVTIIVQDQNDNAPQVLYPVQTGGSVVAEIVPRSADVGYLVTKVVAVDVDSGQNAWLSYRLQKVTDRALFEVGAQNGEIRTVRQVTDKDAVKQKLTVVVEDNGQPSRSAVVNINVAVADTFPEVLSEFTDFTHSKQYNDDLTFYLVLALAAVSFLFITTVVVIISVKIYRWRQSRLFYQSNLPVIPYYPPGYTDTGVTATLPHMYHYDACMTTDSRKSDCKYSTLGGKSVLVMEPSFTETMQRAMRENHLQQELESPEMITYSIPEEMEKGSRIGNIAQDLGLDLKRLKTGKVRLFSSDTAEYVGLNKENGLLLIKEKIDRESLCAELTPCALHLQMILENPMELYSVTVEITDINDNAPNFQKNEMRFEISESALIGARFVLGEAVDPDVGINGLRSYSLKPTDNFVLDKQGDVGKILEMVLQKPLDREKQASIDLSLTAYDGGEPQLSSTMHIHVTVLDANDNAPIFNQKMYKATIPENAIKGTILITVSASDADEGSNSHVTYVISDAVDRSVADRFLVAEKSGEVTLNGHIDYEKSKNYQLVIQAKDSGGFSDTCKLIIDVIDINDNKPNVDVLSMSSSILEESKPHTVVAMLKVNDPDSGTNGQVQCMINDNIPFTITSPSNNFFTLLTEDELDREREAEYNITVTCSDEGVPSLSSSTSLRLHISDVNDNAPVFDRNHYQAHVVENNTPGLSIFTVRASDADFNQNARVSYILEDSTVNGLPVSSYVSVSPDSGVINAARSFDYEQLKEFHFRVRAQDGGSPPLSSNVTVKITIQDQNDNAPQVLYPVQTGGSVVAEIVPRSADVGYLVTKVVAVDVDSGQNAWLSYRLQKVTDRALFEVGAQNGEIRTVRQVTDKDAVKQKLTVVVEDNGQPSRSAVVNINVAVADTFPEVLSEFTDFTHSKQYNDDLTFYLVLALAAVSFLFITTVVVIISVKIYRWRQSRLFYQSNLPVIPYYPPGYTDTGVTATLPHMYHYDACMTTDSRKSKYSTLGGQSVLVMDLKDTMLQEMNENNYLDNNKSPEMGFGEFSALFPRTATVIA